MILSPNVRLCDTATKQQRRGDTFEYYSYDAHGQSIQVSDLVSRNKLTVCLSLTSPPA